jgi:hypothetical protein
MIKIVSPDFYVLPRFPRVPEFGGVALYNCWPLLIDCWEAGPAMTAYGSLNPITRNLNKKS